nr:vesicle-associated membrane protein 724 [Ipomoea batatas]
MGEESFIYSFVARGTMVLAEYTEFTGNFPAIAAQCLHKLPSSNNKFTYNCDHHTFNFLLEAVMQKLARYSNAAWTSQAYCVVAKDSVGKQISIAFLERVKADFKKRYGGGKADTAVAKSLNKEFGPVMKEHMKYIIEHADEIEKLLKVKAQVSEVKSIMLENIDKTIERGENLTILTNKAEDLHNSAQQFKKQGTEIRRKMWYQNMKIKAFFDFCFEGGVSERDGGEESFILQLCRLGETMYWRSTRSSTGNFPADLRAPVFAQADPSSKQQLPLTIDFERVDLFRFECGFSGSKGNSGWIQLIVVLPRDSVGKQISIAIFGTCKSRFKKRYWWWLKADTLLQELNKDLAHRKYITFEHADESEKPSKIQGSVSERQKYSLLRDIDKATLLASWTIERGEELGTILPTRRRFYIIREEGVGSIEALCAVWNRCICLGHEIR